jgi:putative ABC transport system substrate-binding protein
MRRRDFLALVGAAAGGWSAAGSIAASAADGKVFRIGILGEPGDALWKVFIKDMRQRGWIEGQNVTFNVCITDGRVERFTDCAAQLVGWRPDLLIAADGSQATKSLQALTRTIPIVLRGVSDPVAAGFVASLTRPGGNTTGITNRVISNGVNTLVIKYMQLLQEVRPGTTRIAVLWTPENPGSTRGKEDSVAAAPGLGIKLETMGVNGVNDFEPAFAAIVKSGAQALVVHPTEIMIAERQRIIAFALEHKLPTICSVAQMTREGLLMAQGPDKSYEWTRVADYTDRILKGAKPADLPVEQPSKFELIINMKTAKALDLAVPQYLLASADEVIE